MLSAGGDFVNIGEPLNVLNRQTIFPKRVSLWYTHITDINEAHFLRYYEDAMAFRIHPFNDLKRMRFGSPRDPFRVAKHWATFLGGRLQNRRLLIKDPFAVFSIDWFVRRLKCQAVVTVRHPVAVVSSLKRHGFTFEFDNVARQQSLMSGCLLPFQGEIEAALASPNDLVGHGSLLWRIIYDTLPRAMLHQDLLVVRHEDLSRDPLTHYETLFHALGLTFTSHVSDVVQATSSERNPIELPSHRPFRTRLNSRANLANWRHRLDEDEIERILEITTPVVSHYYPEGLAAIDL
jgi:hypothetical protein